MTMTTPSKATTGVEAETVTERPGLAAPPEETLGNEDAAGIETREEDAGPDPKDKVAQDPDHGPGNHVTEGVNAGAPEITTEHPAEAGNAVPTTETSYASSQGA
jgi:hypothetical protein